MSTKEQLKYMVNINRQVAKGILEDVTEPESLIIVDKLPNHIRWITGHIVYSSGGPLMKLGDDKDDWDKLKDLFAGGSVPADDPSIYPSQAELRSWLYDIHERTLAALDRVDEDFFAGDIGVEGKEHPAWQRFTFLYMHEFYHSGQIVQIRRAIGRSSPFG